MYMEMACIRLMPSHNGILTVSCIRTLTQIALKLSEFIPLVSVLLSPSNCFSKFLAFMASLWEWLQDRVLELIRPFRDLKTIWQARIEASKALLDLEFHCKGIDATLSLFVKYLEEEPSLRGL